MKMLNAKNLKELCEKLNKIQSAGKIENIDTTSLPTFGGDEISEIGAFSWDAQNVLVSNPWRIISREKFFGID